MEATAFGSQKARKAFLEEGVPIREVNCHRRGCENRVCDADVANVLNVPIKVSSISIDLRLGRLCGGGSRSLSLSGKRAADDDLLASMRPAHSGIREGSVHETLYNRYSADRRRYRKRLPLFLIRHFRRNSHLKYAYLTIYARVVLNN